MHLAIEGGDYAWKTSVADLLYKRLVAEGHRALRFSEQSKDPKHGLSSQIRELVMSNKDLDPKTHALLMMAARNELFNNLEEGKDSCIWVVDRSVYSTFVYQNLAKDRRVHHHLDYIHSLFLDLGWPDFEVLLTVSPEIREQRYIHRQKNNQADWDWMDDMAKANHELIQDRYKELMSATALVIDTSDKTIEEVVDIVWARLERGGHLNVRRKEAI